MDGDKLKVGDKIVEFGQVYRVFKIIDGVVYYKPYYANKENKSLVFSIPRQNLNQTKIRRPLEKGKIKKIIRGLSRKTEINGELDTEDAKESLKLNSARQTAQILKQLWYEKCNEDKNFTKSKKDVFELAINRFVEEVAFVSRTTVDGAKDKITKALNKTL